MHGHKNADYSGLRKRTAKLFSAVLSKKLSVSDALAKFPKDCGDGTIIACWHALCHLEADEDLRLKDAMYKEEQDKYIKFIMHTLQNGDELPQNIINSYLPYHENSLIPCTNTLKGIINQFKKFLT